MIESIKNLIQNLDTGSIIIVVLFIIILVLLYVFRKTPTVIKIITEGIAEAENNLNGKKGQEKLDMAVDYIQSKTPFILKFIVTKSTVVTVIELLLKFGIKVFGVTKEIDIIGNDSAEIKDINMQIEEKTASFDVEMAKGDEPKGSDSYIYGAVKGETDFHGNDQASIEVGIKKKI